MLKLKGEKLTKVKDEININASCGYSGCYDLTTFVYEIINEDSRAELLNHFRLHRPKKKYLHILSDIDDTIATSTIGGTDTSYFGDIIYPGVIQLFCECKTQYVTLLSARPSSIINKTKNKFKSYCVPIDILGGKIRDLLFEGVNSFIQTKIIGKYEYLDTYNDIALTKVINYIRYASIYPEYSFIFFGDIGQGDIITAKYIINHPQGVAAFIHDISRINIESLWELRVKYEGKRLTFVDKSDKIFIFRDYTEVADILHKQFGLLDKMCINR